jgi:site-specific recombinase XerD
MLSALNASFRRTLRAEDSPSAPVKSYTEAVGLLADFLAARGHPLTVNAVKRADVRDFIADQLDRWKPATALNRSRSLQAFFKWCVAEGELKASPMVAMKPPQLPTNHHRSSPTTNSGACCSPAKGATSPTAATPR